MLNQIRATEPSSAARILPYIGGEDVNADPSHRFQRHVIFLSDVATEDDLTEWPKLTEIVRARVKPERDSLGDNPNNVPLKRRWWAYQAHRPELYSRIRTLSRVLVNSQVSAHLAFAFLPTSWIYAHTLNIFEIESFAGFCLMQSRVHGIWALLLASSLEDRLRYTPSDCFETFPFLVDFDENLALDGAGGAYYEFRADLMQRCNEGLTTIYNWFHDPERTDPDILRLRRLHDAMDRTVLDGYGWSDIQPRCEFFPDLDDENDQANGNGQPHRKRFRYRWADEIHDEVLARLLELNRIRAEEEAQSAAAAPAARAVGKRGRRPVKSAPPSAQGTLYLDSTE